VLAHKNNSPRVDIIAPPRHISLIPRKPVFVLTQLSAACLSEKQQIPILQSLVLTRPELQPTFHLTRGANNYTTDATYNRYEISLIFYMYKNKMCNIKVLALQLTINCKISKLDKISKIVYCEFIIVRGILIFVDFVYIAKARI